MGLPLNPHLIQTAYACMQGMAISEEDLSPEDMRAFQQELASGQLGSLLQPWHPWWLSEAAARLSLTARGTRAVQPIGMQSDSYPWTSDLKLTVSLALC